MLCLDEKKQFLTSTAGKDEWIKEWCLSLHNDGWVRKQDEQQFTPKNRKPAQSFDHPGIIFFFFTKTYATLASVSVLLIDGGSEEGTRFTAKSLAIVCAFLMDALPLVVKWPTWLKALTSTGSRQARVEVTPAQRELTSQYERAAALRRMDSISGPIAFSLTHFQGDLQPCTDRAKVKGRGSD